MTPKKALGSRMSDQFDTYLLDTLRGYSISQQLAIEQRLFTYLMRKVSITSAHYANYAAATRLVLDDMTFEQQLALDQELHPECYI